MSGLSIKKGDTVLVRTGKDRGKTSTVTRALPQKGALIVEGVNMRRRHVRPRRAGQKGEIVQFAAPLTISNMLPVCAKCGKATRVGHATEGTKKVRICKKCGGTF